MKLKGLTIDCKCGIYDTAYKIRVVHKDGTITVSAPYIKWVRGTGILSFRDTRLTLSETSKVIVCFERGKLCIPDAFSTTGVFELDCVLI